MTKNKKLLCTGAGGTIVTALCCFTPLLVVLFGALGVSAWLGWIDYVLFPALGFFVVLTIYALYRWRSHPGETPAAETEESGART